MSGECTETLMDTQTLSDFSVSDAGLAAEGEGGRFRSTAYCKGDCLSDETKRRACCQAGSGMPRSDGLSRSMLAGSCSIHNVRRGWFIGPCLIHAQKHSHGSCAKTGFPGSWLHGVGSVGSAQKPNAQSLRGGAS